MRRQPQPVPPIEQRRQPGLSLSLPYPRRLDQCQSCGVRLAFADLRRWRECDEFDRPTPMIVVLCERCEKKLISAHARLYMQIVPNEPVPGAMSLCIGCRHGVNVACGSPLPKANGGAGLPVHQKAPIEAILCPGGLTRIYQVAPERCDGRDVEVAP